jgi:hypothetical protein
MFFRIFLNKSHVVYMRKLEVDIVITYDDYFQNDHIVVQINEIYHRCISKNVGHYFSYIVW